MVERPAAAPPSPRDLRWADVAPSRHAFDPVKAPAVVLRLRPAARVPVPPRRARPGSAAGGPAGGEAWGDAMTRALTAHYGPWAAGWRWARGEGDVDGGPVTAWCCPRHSITTREATLATVAAALVEWRAWLEELEERFGRFLPLPASAPQAEVLAVWERAVAHLVTLVVERTEAESGWYAHCELVLGWFLSAAGIPASRHGALLRDAVGGRFHSWSEPGPRTVTEVAGRLAAGVATRSGD